jgi:hypothetical protein
MQALVRVQLRHAQYYLGTLGDLGQRYTDASLDPNVLRELVLEWDQIRVGQQWAVSVENPEQQVLELIDSYPLAAVTLLEVRQDWEESIRWLKAAADAAAALGNPEHRARHIGRTGNALTRRGQWNAAMEC